MNFPEFFLKITKEITDESNHLFDYEIIVRQKQYSNKLEIKIEDVQINHEQKRIYICLE